MCFLRVVIQFPLPGVLLPAFQECVNLDAQEEWTGLAEEVRVLGCDQPTMTCLVRNLIYYSNPFWSTSILYIIYYFYFIAMSATLNLFYICCDI